MRRHMALNPPPCRLMYQVGVLVLSRLHWQVIGRSKRTGLCPFRNRLANAKRADNSSVSCGAVYVNAANITYIQTYLCICITQVGAHNCQDRAGGLAGVAGWVVCASAPLDRQLQFAAMLRSCLNVCAQLLLLPLLLLWVSWETKTESEAKQRKAREATTSTVDCQLHWFLYPAQCKL